VENSTFVDIRGGVFINIGNGDSTDLRVENSCFWQVDSLFNRHSQSSLALGILVTVNQNGDSVDYYNNLIADPEIVDSTWQLANTSPCIDAGMDVGEPFEGLAPDIGIREFGRTAVKPRVGTPLAASAFFPTLYPNPANGDVQLQLNLSGPTEIIIYDLLGRVVSREQLAMGSQSGFSLNISALPSGRYFVSAITRDHRDLLPMIILK
jgi:hypothetical protein